ncbi:MAG: hypothetical protein L3K01_02590 [Thermoplasmata archaeon]|jgi:hypothetical protein|nr:hypothetical protein [Thermoplasmata archaeon]
MAAPGKLPSMLYYGDNLPLLRNHDAFLNECMGIVYVGTPFSSNQDNNALFSERGGSRSAGLIKAFTDLSRRDLGPRHTVDEVVEQGGKLGETLVAVRTVVGSRDPGPGYQR